MAGDTSASFADINVRNLFPALPVLGGLNRFSGLVGPTMFHWCPVRIGSGAHASGVGWGAVTGKAAEQHGKDATLGKPSEAYVAFAFAAADLLMEATTEGRIIFAIGASMALVGRPARLLANSAMDELFIGPDRPRIAKVLKRMAAGNRVRHTLLTVEFPHGEHVPVALSGYPHPDHEGRLLCVLTHSGSLTMPSGARRDGDLLDKRDFEALAQNMMQESASGDDENYRMTLLDLPELSELRRKAGAVKTAEFISRFGEYLRQCSIGGDAAAELGQSKYGVIHGPEVNPGEIEDTIQDLIESVVGHQPDLLLQASTRTMDLDTRGLSSQEAARALAFTITAFAAEDGASLQQMANATRPKLSETVDQMRAVKDVIDRGQFDLFVQPIVDLWTGVVHHFECLVRFHGNDASPYETVTFAEDVGLVGELDCAILERAIQFMRSPVGAEESLKFAVNISGRSLGSAATAAHLLGQVYGARDLRGRLLFEVTESAAIADLASANAIIQEIRNLGHPVGLDDFGAGSAAFHYLRALKVDHVKIDGSYVRDLRHHQEAVPFLKAIAQLCRELKVATVAEHIENEETVNLLKVYNVRYGQGYHFGKPVLPQPHRQGAKASWSSQTLRWRNGLLVFGNAPSRVEPTDE